MQYICNTHDINEGESRAFVLKGEPIFGVKRDGQLYFYKNSCPHLGLELEWEENRFLDEEGHIRCHTHGARFDVKNGQCWLGPCKGDSLEAVPVTLNNDQVFLARSDA